MSKENRPAFLFYASDWLSGTADMTLEEKGLFIDMLAQSWLRDGLPTDMERLVLMFGGEANRKRIADVSLKFRKRKIDGVEKLVNDKLEKIRDAERTKFANRSAANSENAKKRRKNVDNTSIELPFESERIANESQAKKERKEDEYIYENESKNEDENIGGAGGNLAIIKDRKPSFDVHQAAARLQEIYSKRQGKPENLRRAYAQALVKMANPPWCFDYDFSRQRIETAAAQCMTYHVRAATETQFIPFPETWLEGGEWETDWNKAQKEIKLSERKHTEEINQDMRKNVKQL